MTMERWDPFSEMLSLRDAMNRLIEESFVWPTRMMATPGRMMVPIDIRETEDSYILEASMPGIKPEDIDITVQGNQIRIRGEMKQEEEREGGHYFLRERRYGNFDRTLSLPVNIQTNQVTCEFRDGLLTLNLPKAEEARPRRIPISGGQQRQIEAAGQTREVGQQTQQTQQTPQGET